MWDESTCEMHKWHRIRTQNSVLRAKFYVLYALQRTKSGPCVLIQAITHPCSALTTCPHHLPSPALISTPHHSSLSSAPWPALTTRPLHLASSSSLIIHLSTPVTSATVVIARPTAATSAVAAAACNFWVEWTLRNPNKDNRLSTEGKWIHLIFKWSTLARWRNPCIVISLWRHFYSLPDRWFFTYCRNIFWAFYLMKKIVRFNWPEFNTVWIQNVNIKI